MYSVEMLSELERKEKLVEKLHKKLDKLTDLEIKEKNERATIFSSDLSKKIEGRITDKAKVAYADKVLKEKLDLISWLKNDVAKLKRDIELVDDRITCYKYAIREGESKS